MHGLPFPVIDPVATGRNIERLRKLKGLRVKDLQRFFNFEEPRAIYKWQRGQTLPSLDNLFALSAILGVPMDAIIVGREELCTGKPQASACGCCYVWGSVQVSRRRINRKIRERRVPAMPSTRKKRAAPAPLPVPRKRANRPCAGTPAMKGSNTRSTSAPPSRKPTGMVKNCSVFRQAYTRPCMEGGMELRKMTSMLAFISGMPIHPSMLPAHHTKGAQGKKDG